MVVKALSSRYPRREHVAALEREFHLTRRLAAVDGVIAVDSLVKFGQGGLAMVSEGFGHSLAAELGERERVPLAIDRVLTIAIQLARILGELHEHDVVHKNISPSSVLVDGDDDVRVVDFSIASELGNEHQGTSTSRRLEGSFPYLSPEQTGRMNRGVDYRSDFYSLGVTLFELLTATLPFEATHPLQWVHQHICAPVPKAGAVNAEVPQQVSSIVAKLMSKDAKDRYQSAHGLMVDLDLCRSQHRDGGIIVDFPLAEQDVSRRFHIPQQLVGRDAALSQLLGLFEIVAAGGVEFCTVVGDSGIGKTAIVNEMGATLVRDQGYLIHGKFDQFRSNTAFSALASAFRDLIAHFLTESPKRLEALRAGLIDALGSNAQLIVDIVPDLEKMIGEQPSVPDLPPTEAQNRFRLVFAKFVRVVATKDHPLVVFLDDLQWSDAPTLELIRHLLASREIGHLLLIGAYRPDEVDVGHPLNLALKEISATQEVHRIELGPLDAADVETIVAATVRCDESSCVDLADLLHRTAHGNPFFINELLQNLHDEGLIVFDPNRGVWTWDIERVVRSGITDNIAEFMVANLRRLPAATQRALQLAACIGNRFDLETLSVIAETSTHEIADVLLVALKRNMVIPLDDDYQLVGRSTDGGDPTDRAINPTYAFHHDRVQQAAYQLIDEDRRQETHLRIGRSVQEHAVGDAVLDERLIEIVTHLNQGRNLITSDDERRHLAELNLGAGIRAKRSSAYNSALQFLSIGIELMSADAWERDYTMSMALRSEYQQCSYLVGHHDEANDQIELILRRARTDIERAEVLALRTRQYATLGRMPESIEAAIEGLELLGIDFPLKPTTEDIAAEVLLVAQNLGTRDVEDLIHAPQMTEGSELVAVRLLMEIFPAAFLSGSGDLFPFLVLKSVNISLTRGRSPESAFAYAAYGMLLCGGLQQPALGFRYGKLAVAMNEQFDDIALKSRVLYLNAMFIHHWSAHWSTLSPWFRRGIEAGYQSGDLLYLAYNAQDCIIWDPTLELEAAAAQHREYLEIVRECEYQDSFDSGTLFLQMQLNFLGRTEDECSLSDNLFDEDKCVQGMRERKFMTGVANYHIYKTEVCVMYGRYDVAYGHVLEQDQLVASTMSLPQSVRYCLTAFLTMAGRYPDLDSTEQAQVDQRLNQDIDQMTRWADNCPVNFLHLKLLMEAERHRLAGDVNDALATYDGAIDRAHAAGFVRDEAMSNELAARCLLAAGRTKAAEGYLRAAHHLFDRWGASRKTAQMTREFGSVLVADVAGSDSVSLSTDAGVGQIAESSLDMESVIRASQAISGELILDNLWNTTLPLLLESAGGQRCCVVIRRHAELTIEAQATAPGLENVRPPFAIDDDADEIMAPLSVINFVCRTGEAVVADDPAEAGRFSRDTYLVNTRPRSVLCVPISRPGRFEGALYIENSVASGVFTEARIEVIKLLAAQALISLDNAGLYQDQVRLTQAQSRFVPRQFLEHLEHDDISAVGLGEHITKDMSVMFADLRGFTPLVEMMHPRDVVQLLNRYFVSLEPPITGAGGFIDSFAGDEVMALFDGAADKAVEAGIGMSRALDEFNARSAESGDPQLRFGIGVNTGPLLLGTVGTHDRIQCTVVGDTVNAAARIEQLTKVYFARFLIGQHTHDRLQRPDQFSVRAIDRVAVKGKTKPFDIYEVLDAESPARRAAKEASREALDTIIDTYRARRFRDALAMAREAVALDPHDGVFALYVDRCSRFVDNPPPDSWAGVEDL